jgi:hypothetical protein
MDLVEEGVYLWLGSGTKRQAPFSGAPAELSTDSQFPFRPLDDPFRFFDPPAQLAGVFFTFYTGYRLV